MVEKVLESARARFPKSANATVRVRFAWHPEHATTPTPERYGSDGWDPIGELATRRVLERLRDEGYTTVTLECGGTTYPFRDVAIEALLAR